MGLREGPHSQIIARAPRDVTLLERAARDLLDLHSVERAMLARAIDQLAMDALPRGVASLDGLHRDHLRLRVGRFRVLYRVNDGELVIVAVTTRVP